MRIRAALLTAAALMMGVGSGALAQSLPQAPPSDRICNTILTCNFARNAPVRGCLSSYSCRRCAFVKRCQTISGKRICDYQERCGWRGV